MDMGDFRGKTEAIEVELRIEGGGLVYVEIIPTASALALEVVRCKRLVALRSRQRIV
jgi:hypothetical protein